MSGVFSSIIEYLFPEDSKSGNLFEPFQEEAAAIMTSKLQEQLNSCEDEDDKQGAISDYLYDLYTRITSKFTSEDEFVDKFSAQFDDLSLEDPVKVPKFEIIRGGKSRAKSSSTSNQAINPLNGRKLAIGGRRFKQLLNEGYFNEDGSYTDKGQTAWDEMVSNKPEKVPHPTRTGGKINRDGDVYNKFISNGYSYDPDTKNWTSPESEVSDSAVSSKRSSKASSEASEQSSAESTPEKTYIPHPTRKGATLLMGGRGYQKFISQGWTYDEDNQEWSE